MAYNKNIFITQSQFLRNFYKGSSKSQIRFTQTNSGKLPKNDQMKLITTKLIDSDNNVEWSPFIEELLSSRGSLNKNNLDAVLIKSLLKRAQMNKAKSYIDYITMKNKNISIGATNAIMLYYSLVGIDRDLSLPEKNYIEETYKKLISKYKVLDFITYDSFLGAFATASNYQMCLEILEKITLLDTPSQSAYSSTAEVLFNNNKENEAMNVIKDSLVNGRALKESVYTAWINYYCQNIKDESLKQKIEVLLEFISNLDEPLTLNVVTMLKNVFENQLKWKATISTVSAHGKCDNCQKNLKHLTVTGEEFRQLQEAFKENVLVGKNCYIKSSPSELEKFKKFLDKSESYDIVIDGLNISYCIGIGSAWEKSKFLADVVGYFLRKKKKVLVLGRKHMLKWPAKNLKLILQDTKHFLTDDLSQDDPFFLTAALQSGPNTDIVSRDKLRGHRFLLGDLKLRSSFLRWQWQHQWAVFTINRLQPSIRQPLSFTPCAQQTSPGCWHIPFHETTTHKDPINTDLPNKWLCITPQDV